MGKKIFEDEPTDIEPYTEPAAGNSAYSLHSRIINR